MSNRHIAQELLGVAEHRAGLRCEDDECYGMICALVGIGHAMLDVGNAIRGKADGEPEALVDLAVAEGRKDEFINELVEQLTSTIPRQLTSSERQMLTRTLAGRLRHYFGWDAGPVTSRRQHDREPEAMTGAVARPAAPMP